MRRFIAACVSLSLVTSASASPRVLVECGEPKGTSYYFEGGIVGPGQGGNRPDGMDGGRVRLIQDGDTTFVETRDAVGNVRRMKPERTTAFTRKRDDGGISIVSSTDDASEQVVDTFLFSLNAALVGSVVWQFTKLHPAVTKASTFTAPCRPAL